MADFVKVLDFGLVKLMQEDAEEMTKTGLFLGSPNYMSPEQIRADKLDPRSDLYSLGVLLYMGLTATSPFKRESSVKVLLAQLEDPPEPFSEVLPAGMVPESLEWVVMTCLQKDRNRRFSSVAQLSRALKACAAEIRGLVDPLEMSLKEGELLLHDEITELLDESSQASGLTRGELQAARSRVAKPQPSVGAGGSLVTAHDLDDDSRATEPSLPAVTRAGQGWGQTGHRAGIAVFLMILGLLTLAAVLLRGADSPPEQAPMPDTSANVVIEDMPDEPAGASPEAGSSSLTAVEADQPMSDPSAPGMPTSKAPTTTEPALPRTSRAETRPRATTRARSSGSSRSARTGRSRTASDGRGAAPDRVKRNPAATEARSDVGSTSTTDETGSGKEGAASKATSPKKKKGDLRDPWGD
jgi:serine/threonine protein kinase